MAREPVEKGETQVSRDLVGLDELDIIAETQDWKALVKYIREHIGGS